MIWIYFVFVFLHLWRRHFRYRYIADFIIFYDPFCAQLISKTIIDMAIKHMVHLWSKLAPFQYIIIYFSNIILKKCHLKISIIFIQSCYRIPLFSCHVHQSRHDVTIFYDNVACLQIAQYVNSRHWDNFFTQHSYWISQYTLYFINLNRNSFQITLIENADRYFYLEMHSVLSGFKGHRRFNIFFRKIIDVHYTKNMEYLLSGNYVLYRDRKKQKA